MLRVITVTAPLVGAALVKFLAGGNEFGNLTLTRFYAVHAMLLPLLLVVFGLAHVAAMRKYGITALNPDSKKDEPFWPRQALYDSAFSLLLLAVLFAVARRGAVLQGPADPCGAANPRPEWYFRPRFQLLKVLPESAPFVLPLIVTAFLFAIPLIDKRARGAVLALLFGGAVAAA